MKILETIDIRGRHSLNVCNFCKNPHIPYYNKAECLVKIRLFKGFIVWLYFCKDCLKKFKKLLKKK